MNNITDIVIIDDDEIACFIYSQVLEDMQLPHHVHCITDSTKALEFLEQKCQKGVVLANPGCILVVLDAHMPIMDGFELLAELDKCTTIDREKIHIVLLTAILTDREIKKASKHKLHGVYYKPLTRELVQQIITSIPAPCA